MSERSRQLKSTSEPDTNTPRLATDGGVKLPGGLIEFVGEFQWDEYPSSHCEGRLAIIDDCFALVIRTGPEYADMAARAADRFDPIEDSLLQSHLHEPIHAGCLTTLMAYVSVQLEADEIMEWVNGSLLGYTTPHPEEPEPVARIYVVYPQSREGRRRSKQLTAHLRNRIRETGGMDGEFYGHFWRRRFMTERKDNGDVMFFPDTFRE